MPKVLKVSSGGVPAGTYIGQLVAVEDVQADAQRGYGAGLKWVFQIAKGEQAGQQAARITTATPTPKNACGRMLNGLLGRAIQPGDPAGRGRRHSAVYREDLSPDRCRRRERQHARRDGIRATRLTIPMRPGERDAHRGSFQTIKEDLWIRSCWKLL